MQAKIKLEKLSTFKNAHKGAFSPDGTKLDADIDIFNPNWKGGYGLGAVLHSVGEAFIHDLGKWFGGRSKTNPYNVAYRSSWECR